MKTPTVPAMPRLPQDTPFHKANIASRALLEHVFHRSGYRLCEYSFAVQACWHEYNQSEWAVSDGWTFLRYQEEGVERFICPVGVGDPSSAIEACFAHLVARGHPPVVRFVPEIIASRLDPNRFVIEHDPDNDDYVYAMAEMVELKGRKFAKKRNHIAQFIRVGPWSFDPVTPEDRPAIDAFLEEWCLQRECEEDPLLEFEMQALATCLDNLTKLTVSAYVLRGVDGTILGLSVGGPLIADTWTIHFEKALSSRAGTYQVLAREFARQVPADVKWLDREQDMGVENLRRAKESLHPSHLETAWTVRPK